MPNSSRMKWPYPSEGQDPWYEAFKGLIAAQDASGFASREDRHLIIGGGGTVAWTIPTFSWSSSVYISGGLTGFMWEVPPTSVTVEDGQVVYVTMSRGPTSNVTVSVAVSNQVPSSDQTLVIAVRIGSKMYLRSGVSLASGDTIIEFSPAPAPAAALEVDDEGALVDASVSLIDFTGEGVVATQTAPGQVEVNVLDRHAPAIIVGNSVNGDTLAVCHYLDTGNGAQLSAAIASAGAGEDVYVRPGTYDFSQVGGPTGAIVIPNGVRVRGAGRGHVLVKTRTVGDMGAFDVGYWSELEDLTIHALLPTGAPTPRDGVVELTGIRSAVRRVTVDYPDVWTAPDVANYDIFAAFLSGPLSSRTIYEDCIAGDVYDLPSFYTLTGVSILRGFSITGVLASVGCEMIRSKVLGGDIGIASALSIRIRDADVYDPVMTGIILSSEFADSSDITGCHIELDTAIQGIGIRLIEVNCTNIQGNYIFGTVGAVGTYGISLATFSRYNVISNNRIVSGWEFDLRFDVNSDENIISHNTDPNGGTLRDLSDNNEIAHNVGIVVG